MATPADLVRRGHFGYESGHHGDIWLELDLLVSQPKRMRALPGGTVVDGHKAVVVDDAINVGRATGATVAALREAGCGVVALASVMVCTPRGPEVGRRLGVPQVWLAEVPIKVWEPADCPLCRAGGVPAAAPV